MHELSLAGAVLEAALDHAAGRTVVHVQLRIGELRQVVPDALDFAWDLITQGTAAEKATLAVETVTARVRCRSCAHECDAPTLPLRCAACGAFDVDITRGDEFLIDWIDVDSAPPPPVAGLAPREDSGLAVS